MRRLITASALAACLLTGPARADDASRLALARELVAQIHLDDLMRSALPLMASQMRTLMAQQGHSDTDAETFMTLFQRRTDAEIGRYGDAMAAAYAREFTEDDLDGMLAFDRTPLGQKIIAKNPVLLQESALAGRQLGQEIAQEVIADMERQKEQATTPNKL